MSTSAFDASELARRRAGVWYPECADVEVVTKVLGSQDRAGVRVDFIEVAVAGFRRDVVVKQYHSVRRETFESRPRLGLDGDAGAKPRLEFNGLVDLREAYRDVSIRVRPVVPLEFLPEHRALVVERFPGVDARDALKRRDVVPTAILTAGGASLALAHASLERSGHDRLVDADEIQSAFEQFCAFARDGVLDGRLIGRVESWWHAHPMVGVPESGACHADCAPRNLLWDADANVAWIDGLFRSIAPVYQDVAFFVTSCRIAARRNPAARLLGRPGSEEVVVAFLDGYRSQADLSAEWLARFEVLVLLDRLASMIVRQRTWRTRVVQQLVEVELGRAIDRD